MEKIVLGLMAVLVLSLGIFVWPTAYKYEKVTFGGINSIVRINRFSGNPELLLPGGWTRMEVGHKYKTHEVNQNDYVFQGGPLDNQNTTGSDIMPKSSVTITTKPMLIPEGFVLDGGSNARK